jgi:hypothetical protein
MASQIPLRESELIDCARANSEEDIATASYNCGYGDNIELFQQELRRAGESIGVNIENFSDLTDTPRAMNKNTGIEIAPETPNKF